MQIKTMKAAQLSFLGNSILPVWEESKKEIKIKGQALFNLIAVKKEIEKHLAVIQETITTMAERHGGVLNPQVGGYEIPEENREAANRDIMEFNRGEIEIHYAPIIIGPNDELPVDILDAFFDFIQMTE